MGKFSKVYKKKVLKNSSNIEGMYQYIKTKNMSKKYAKMVT